MNRRSFLYWTGAGMVGWQGLGRGLMAAETAAESTAMVGPLLAWLPDGGPLPEERLQRLYFLDLTAEPLANPPATWSRGSCGVIGPGNTRWP